MFWRNASNARHDARRARMVEAQLVARDIVDARVLEAMAAVPRHAFVPADVADDAYRDCPLSIGDGQTISQPYIVALMTELALGSRIAAGDVAVPRMRPPRVLDVGTGCGYQAAVLAHALAPRGGHVHSVEIVPRLADEARDRLAALGFDNVTVHQRDGSRGLPEAAPFDAIVVAAAAPRLAVAWVDALAAGGRLVAPVGPDGAQELLVVERGIDGALSSRAVCAVRFVPLVAEPALS